MRPLGPTMNGSERAFQLPLSRGCQVLPSSRETSEPLVPAVIQSFSNSDHVEAGAVLWGRLNGDRYQRNRPRCRWSRWAWCSRRRISAMPRASAKGDRKYSARFSLGKRWCIPLQKCGSLRFPAVEVPVVKYARTAQPSCGKPNISRSSVLWYQMDRARCLNY